MDLTVAGSKILVGIWSLVCESVYGPIHVMERCHFGLKAPPTQPSSKLSEIGLRILSVGLLFLCVGGGRLLYESFCIMVKHWALGFWVGRLIDIRKGALGSGCHLDFKHHPPTPFGGPCGASSWTGLGLLCAGLQGSMVECGRRSLNGVRAGIWEGASAFIATMYWQRLSLCLSDSVRVTYSMVRNNRGRDVFEFCCEYCLIDGRAVDSCLPDASYSLFRIGLGLRIVGFLSVGLETIVVEIWLWISAESIVWHMKGDQVVSASMYQQRLSSLSQTGLGLLIVGWKHWSEGIMCFEKGGHGGNPSEVAVFWECAFAGKRKKIMVRMFYSNLKQHVHNCFDIRTIHSSQYFTLFDLSLWV